MFRNNVKEKLEQLTRINDKFDCYKEFEVALMLYLRSDLESFDDITDKQLDKIFELTDNVDSLLDINYEDIDYILETTDEELDNYILDRR